MKFDEITWSVVPNTVADRMIDSSLTHKFVRRKLLRRNKAMNVLIKQLQSLKSYRQYVEIKTSILRCLTDNSETEDNISFSEDDNSLANYTQLISEERNNYFYKKEFKTSENNDVSPRRRSTQKSKQKSSITLGWQKVVKSENTSSLTRESNANNFICDNNNDNNGETSSAKNNIKKNTQNKMNTLTKYPINCTKQNTSNLENQLPIKNETNVATIIQKVTNNNDESGQSNSLLINDINEEFQSDENHYKILNSPNVKTLKDLPASLDNLNEIQNINDENMPFDQNCPNQMKQNSNITEIIMNETLIIGNTYQPKDSGIDEDTEEEFLENGKTHKIFNNKTQDKEQDTSSTTSVLNNLRNSDNDLKSETYNMSDKKEYFQDTTSLTIENINMKDKMQTKKPQSIVTHTEIVNRKYKIVPSISVFTKDTEQEELSTNNSCDDKVEIEETKQTEDDIFHSSESQLSQFGRLNLTVDSESSTVDSDFNVENMIDKLYKRSVSDSSSDIELSFTTNKSAQYKLDLNHTPSRVFDKIKNIKESNEKNLELGSMTQSVDKKSTCGRPYNLQEFVKKENLMPKTTEPSFTFKDIEEEEEEQAFITIPRSILENKLVGNKIVLTEKTLKLGKEKYKIKYKNKDNMSSIFGRKDSKVLYRIINIKPIASVVTQGKITKANEIKDDIISKRQNFKKKHLNIDE